MRNTRKIQSFRVFRIFRGSKKFLREDLGRVKHLALKRNKFRAPGGRCTPGHRGAMTLPSGGLLLELRQPLFEDLGIEFAIHYWGIRR